LRLPLTNIEDNFSWLGFWGSVKAISKSYYVQNAYRFFVTPVPISRNVSVILQALWGLVTSRKLRTSDFKIKE